MTTPPRLVLPSSAMPWGRWAEDSAQGTESALDAMRQDVRSAGSQFRARADNIASQINGIGAFTMTKFDAPGFSGSFSAGSIGSSWIMALSSTYSFTPPTQRARSATVITTFHMAATNDNAADEPVMRVNGIDFGDRNHASGRPGPTWNNGWYSVIGTVPLGDGESVSVQYGGKLAPTVTTSWSVDDSSIWIAYFGGL